MKKYIKPSLKTLYFSREDIMTLSVQGGAQGMDADSSYSFENDFIH